MMAPITDPETWGKELYEKKITPKQSTLIHDSTLENISAAICDVGEPILGEDTVETIDDFKKSISIASLAWNFALFPFEKRLEYVNGFLASIDASESDDLREILEVLIQRKLLLYPEVMRMVIDQKVKDTPKGFYVNILSTANKSNKLDKSK